MAALLAALWQLSKLLAMHAGGVAAGTGRLLKGGKEARRGRKGGRGGRAVQQWCITTQNLGQLGNEDLVQGTSDIPKISKYG
jgi:hypothetical protein